MPVERSLGHHFRDGEMEDFSHHLLAEFSVSRVSVICGFKIVNGKFQKYKTYKLGITFTIVCCCNCFILIIVFVNLLKCFFIN
jgi:hypothetical protein